MSQTPNVNLDPASLSGTLEKSGFFIIIAPSSIFDSSIGSISILPTRGVVSGFG